MTDYFSFGSNTVYSTDDWKDVEIPFEVSKNMDSKMCQLLLENNNTNQKQIDQLIKENLLLRQSIEKLIVALKTSTISS